MSWARFIVRAVTAINRLLRTYLPQFLARFLSFPDPWIHKVSQSIAKGIETKNNQHEYQAGKDHDVWRQARPLETILQHGTPFRRRRRKAEPQKTEPRHGHDGARNHQADLHNSRY